ncbi:MAG: trk system potassium uptake protein TrkA [Pirellulaceae bacterium]
MCLAVTGNDEVNILAASMSKAMGTRRSIARVYAPVFRDLSTFDYQRHFNIDRMLSLEHLTATELAREIRNPGSFVVENFAHGELEVQEVTVDAKSKHTGKALKDLAMPKSVRIGSIKREDSMWIAGPVDMVEVGDILTLIGRQEDLDGVRKMFRKGDTQKTSVVIAGGGETGYHLAQALANDHYDILLMEANKSRCEFLAKNLPTVTVVQADATRRSVLEEERVDSADVFVACTGEDENNIMAGVEAREIGTAKILAIVGRPDYANVVGKLGIDRAVSEREVMAKQILGFLNHGPVVSRTELTGGPISVLEIEVEEGAPVTEHVLAKIPFPAKTLIAAVMREGHPPSVPGADDRLQTGDTVIALIDNASVEETLLQFIVR